MRGREYEANQTNKRGIVVDRDPTKQKIRVQFDDEDGVVSHWIDVLASAGGSTKTYMMPDMGDEVWCALDAKGEDGCLMGVKYNAQNAPPFGSNDDIGLVWPGGFFHLNKGSGAVTVQTDGAVVINSGGAVTIESGKTVNVESAGAMTIKSGGSVTIESSGTVKIDAASIKLESGSLTHNGIDIGSLHAHKFVKAGVEVSGPPK
jgi:phage baseplate assembly protein V